VDELAPLPKQLSHGMPGGVGSVYMEGQAGYSNIRTESPPLQVLLDERVLDVPDHLLDLLPVGVYVCDRAGLIVRYNRAAAELWGCSPKIGDPTVRFCGSYRLYGLNGDLVPHAKCPMGDVLATGQGLRDQQIVIERPEGARIVALVNIEAIKDSSSER
jgi:PAS domain-containing protein